MIDPSEHFSHLGKDSWQFISLKRFARVVNGSTPKADPENWNGEILWVTPEDLGQNKKKELRETKRMITEEGYNSCGTELIPAKNVIISCRAPIGHLVINDEEMCFNQGCKGLVVKPGLTSDFLYYVLSVSKEPLNSLGQGTTFVELGKSGLGALKVPVPSLDVQYKISAFLDLKTKLIDDLIAKKEQLLKLLAEKRTALITQAVTKGLDPTVKMKDSGVEWLGEIPESWGVTKFKYEIYFQEGPGILAKDFEESGVPLLRIRNLKGEGVQLEGCNYLDPAKVEKTWKQFRLDLDDLLITTSATTGIVSKVTEQAVGAIPYTGIIRLKPLSKESIKLDYIKLLVSSEIFFSQIDMYKTGSTIQHFGPYHLRQMIITLPPVLVQEKIVWEIEKRVLSITRVEEKLTKSLEALKEYRSSLITAAVTGKLNLTNYDQTS